MLRVVSTDKYMILFNPQTGVEILSGIHGHPDPFKLDYPSLLDIGIMGTCLNNCEFCYQGQGSKPNMTVEDFRKIIFESKSYTNQVALGGRGDPNLHENFEEILKICRENNIVPNYTTSGRNLTDEHIKLTKQYCGAVAVSMYHGDFTFDALNRFMYYGVKTNIHWVLSNKSFEKSIRLIDGEDVWDGKVNLDRLNAIIFLLFKPQGRGKDLDWHLSKDQILEFSEIIKSPNTKFKVGMDSCLVNKVMQSRELSEKEKLFLDTCEGGRMSCYISPDMKLIPCSFGCHDIYGVEIKENSIKDIWNNNEIFNNFRESLEKDRSCCPFQF